MVKREYHRERNPTYTQRRKTAVGALKRGRGLDPQRRSHISNLTLPTRNPRKNEVSTWMRDADNEMAVARVLLEKGSPELYRALLESLHDAVEKNMKAVIVYEGVRVPRGREGHDLVYLEDLLKEKGLEIPVEHREALEKLILVYPRTRYEETGPLPSEFRDGRFLEKLLGQVEGLNRWLKTKSG